VGRTRLAGDITFEHGATEYAIWRDDAPDNTTGGAVAVRAAKGGNASGGNAGAGGPLDIVGGEGGLGDATTYSPGGGGSLDLLGGAAGQYLGGGVAQPGGNVTVKGGAGSLGGNADGGGAFMQGGLGRGTGDGGLVDIDGGIPGATGTGGVIKLGLEYASAITIGGASNHTVPVTAYGSHSWLDPDNNQAFLDLTDGGSAGAAATDHGRIRYNETTDRIESSENNQGYFPISAPYAAFTSSTTTTTTTSTTDTAVTGMTLTTPNDGGKHWINFSCSVSNNTNNTTVFVSLYVGGTQVAHTQRRYTRGNQTLTMPLQTQVIGVDGNTTVDVRWRTTGGTATMYERSIQGQSQRSGWT
jgi:hypothetical protein